MLADIELLVGRVLTSIIFLSAGWEKIRSPAGTAEYIGKAGGIAPPLVMPLLYLSIVVEVVGALMLIFGVRARLAALIIFLWLIPVTFLIHFRNGQMLEVMKNLCIMGGLLAFAAYGAGRFSVDGPSPERSS